MWSTHHLLLRSGLWWKLSKREGEKKQWHTQKIHVSLNRPQLKSTTHIFAALIKSWLENTSRDSFKFCQLLGKSGQARFMQHDLLHKGIEQGELLVPPTELGELGMEETHWKKGHSLQTCCPLPHSKRTYNIKETRQMLWYLRLCVLLKKCSYHTEGQGKMRMTMNRFCLHQ